jgi:hypothetical protein
MTTTRKQYSPKLKARVALEAIRGERTLNQLASQYHVHPVDFWASDPNFVEGKRMFLSGGQLRGRSGSLEAL